jgi:two-component system NarL family sensor kinase
MLDNTIREMRRVAHNMMPEMLVKYGLDTALKELCVEISRSTGLKANYQSIEMDKIEIEQPIAIAIYRIVQELSGNAIKHAGAKILLVQIHALPDEKQLAITVEDDGKGFEPTQLEATAGMGWMNIRNRVDFLKGKLDINSAPGTGTSVLLEINY